MPKAVMIVTEKELAERCRRGLDRFDEMWEGVLHMAPPPDTEHQDFEGRLEGLVRRQLGQLARDVRVLHGVAIADPARWPDDFRVPDIVVCLDRADVREKYAVRADLAVEIRSPDDETFEKFPFYAKRDVTEILVIDRDAGTAELHRRRGRHYDLVEPDPRGWLASKVGLEFRWDSVRRTLAVRSTGDKGSGETV